MFNGSNLILNSDVDNDKAQITKKIHDRSTALERSVNKILDGLNMFNGTDLILNSGVGQDT